MILTCPSCAAYFLVDPAQLGAAGRVVRCGKCKHQWHATMPVITLPGDDHLHPHDPSPPPPLSPHAGILPAEKAPSSAAIRNAIMAALFLAVLLAMPVLWWRFHGAFALLTDTKQEEAIEQPVVLDGIPTTLQKQEEGRTILVIEGAVLNKSYGRQKLPQLKAQALDARGHVIKEWVIPLSVPELESKQRLPFSFATPFNEQGVVDIGFHFLPQSL